MEEATEKQIKFAKQLGIEGADSFSKQALKEMIDKKIKERDAAKTQKTQSTSVSAPNTAMSVILNRTEKPHSYEFGPANNRHKIYYADLHELIEHKKALVENGLAEPDNFENDED